MESERNGERELLRELLSELVEELRSFSMRGGHGVVDVSRDVRNGERESCPSKLSKLELVGF